jgi:cytochrome c553
MCVLACFALAFAVQAQSPPRAQAAGSVTLPDSIASRVLACGSCHGPQGEGSQNDYFPRLAGKPAGYLYNQLLAFRDGRRKYAPMTYLLEYLPDAYLQEMAQYFATQQTPFPRIVPPKVSADVMALGEKLALNGDPARRIPACVACHGASLTGLSPDIPGLLGLHAKYISAQLGASRFGARVTDSPNCMQRITVLLSDADITAVSAWLSARPAPLNPAPATEGSLALAQTCVAGVPK